MEPYELTQALLREAQATGHCTLRTGAEVVGLDCDEDKNVCGVRLAGGEVIECDATVTIALGPWSCMVEEWLDYPMPIEGTWSTSFSTIQPTAMVWRRPRSFARRINVAATWRSSHGLRARCTLLDAAARGSSPQKHCVRARYRRRQQTILTRLESPLPHRARRAPRRFGRVKRRR